MAKILKKLIEKQTIRIDGHKRCVPNESNDIHIHKSENNKQHNNGYVIRIPLVGIPAEHVLDALPRTIQKEIKSVFRNEQAKKEFLESVYKTLTENFDWKRNPETEAKIINNILTAFDMLPYKPRVDVINAKTQKRNVIQMMRHDYNTLYQIVFNYSKESVYIGQFQLGSMTGIRTDVQKKWIETLEENLQDILTTPDTKAALNRIRIFGISDKVIEKTLDAIERIYGDKQDFTDEETK